MRVGPTRTTRGTKETFSDFRNPSRTRWDHRSNLFCPVDSLFTLGKLAIPPLVFAKDDESEAIAIIHVGRSLCGHDGIIHGGLLATLLDETLARNALLNLPAKVGVTANLSVNYRAPARADQFIVIHTHLDKVNGRKATVSVLALFVQPKYAHLLSAHGEVEKLLGSRNTASQEVGPDRAKKPIKVPQEAAV
ncbi:Thioesterase superfamily [Rhizoctonia solani]|uniref:Thioesterase superfamily n=1 Tax=Rhizoctonia solani TaxID=456999 RepID=A0A8H7IDQ9_9AGAM|nr:Thioesterase superfamily [Rhizoctonia solani]